MMSNEMLCMLYDMGKPMDYLFFFRPTRHVTLKGVLSQWFMSEFSDNGITYSSAEKYMMAQKALLFGDSSVFEQIMCEDDPSKLKKYGRLVKGFRDDVWDKEKYRIVLKGNILKFSSDPALFEALMETGDSVLVEASPYDNVWGIKMDELDPYRFCPHNWRGENLLGQALMETRSILASIKS